MTESTKSNLTHAGECLAKDFLDNTHNPNIVIDDYKLFLHLSEEQQTRFFMFLAGAITKHRQDLSLK